MDPQTQPNNLQNTPGTQTPPVESHDKSSIGSIIGIIIIIAVIILGGLYFWGKRIEEAKLKEQLVTESMQQTKPVDETATIKNVNSSDDLSSIEADLNGTNLDNLDSEMNIQLQ